MVLWHHCSIITFHTKCLHTTDLYRDHLELFTMKFQLMNALLIHYHISVLVLTREAFQDGFAELALSHY